MQADEEFGAFESLQRRSIFKLCLRGPKKWQMSLFTAKGEGELRQKHLETNRHKVAMVQNMFRNSSASRGMSEGTILFVHPRHDEGFH